MKSKQMMNLKEIVFFASIQELQNSKIQILKARSVVNE